MSDKKWSQLDGVPEFALHDFIRGWIAASSKINKPKGWTPSWTDDDLRQYHKQAGTPEETIRGDWNTWVSEIRKNSPLVKEKDGVDAPWTFSDYYKKRAALLNRIQRTRNDGGTPKILYIPLYPSKSNPKPSALSVMDELYQSLK